MTRPNINLGVLAFSVFVTAAAMLPAARAAAGGKAEKVAICHVPPGNPANAHTITVGTAAVEAHFAHGDYSGPCTAACRENRVACGHNAECCSGLCADGTCVQPCAQDGSACGANGDCCGGNCADGICAAACGADASPCETGGDCCSGICTETTKTCASDCTIGPELHGPECHTGLDCCEGEGVCILGLCYAEATCAAVGAACDIESDVDALFCCFDNVCLNGVCVAP